jgi:hypothetical protein
LISSFTVIPAQAGIQVWRRFLDSRLRGNDVLEPFSDKLPAFPSDKICHERSLRGKTFSLSATGKNEHRTPGLGH